jgi:tetratricopeptide (TPR) repeat protein
MYENETPITVWPFELFFACVLAALTAIPDNLSLILFLRNAALGAVAYILGYVLVRSGHGKFNIKWWSGDGVVIIVLAVLALYVFVVYYVIVAAVCRRLILPIVFRVAGISPARIPLVLKRKSDRDGKPDRAIATHNRATADLDQTVQLNPNDARVYHNRGFAYYQQGDLDRAIADYNRAIELQPDNARVYLVRGLAYQQQGQRDRAIADYRKALELSRDPKGRTIAQKALQELEAK